MKINEIFDFTFTTCFNFGRKERSRFRRRTICFLRSAISVCNVLQSSFNLKMIVRIITVEHFFTFLFASIPNQVEKDVIDEDHYP